MINRRKEEAAVEKKYTYEDFLEIIKTLRSENGCPWDREQTHESLRPCMMEEAAEVLAAIRIYNKTGNAENLQEELGDVLLQVVMHAQIAQEEGLFTMEEVVDGIAGKMVHRHPHVFGTVQADSSEQVLQNWEEIKRKEKEGRSWVESPLREIPAELPALTRASKVVKKADKHYGRKICYQDAVQTLSEGVKKLELLSEQDRAEKLPEIMGALLMAEAQISALYKLPLEQILTDRTEDVIDACENG